MNPRHTAGVFLFISCIFFNVAHADTPCPYTWNTTLKIGSRGAEVRALQKLLTVESTGYFGKVTARAVADFQTQHSLESVGFVGPKTRTILNAQCEKLTQTPPTTPTPETVTSHLIVAPSGQPSPTLAPPGALFVPFTRFSLTAGSEDVEVKNITVARVGAGQDQAFDYIGLLDGEGTEVTFGYLNSTHQTVMRDSITIPAHTTETFTIVGGMISDVTDYDGQMPQLALVSLEASAPLSGPLPITGTPQRVTESLTIGTAEMEVSHFDPHGAFVRYIDDTNVRMAGVRIAAGAKEELIVKEITWEQTGTAGPSDITNVRTVVQDVSYPAEVDGRWYTSTLPSIRIPKGTSIDVYVAIDMLPGSANRTVKFNIRESTNIVLYGAMYGYGIAPYPVNNTDVSGESVFLTSDGTTDGDSLYPYYSGPTASVYGATVNAFSKQ